MNKFLREAFGAQRKEYTIARLGPGIISHVNSLQKTFAIVHFGQFCVNYIIFVSFSKTNCAFWSQIYPKGGKRIPFGRKKFIFCTSAFFNQFWTFSKTRRRGDGHLNLFSLKIFFRTLCIVNFLW